MTSLTGRKHTLQRVTAVSFVAALGLLLFAGPALSDPSKPPPRPSDPPTAAVPKNPSSPPTGAPEAPGVPGTTAEDSGVQADEPTPPPGEPRFDTIDSPGVITCEDLGLGQTLMKVNGARMNHVQDGDGLSGVVRDTDIDTDGDPDSLFVTIDPGVVVTSIVYMHGNRGHIYESEFAPGYHGAFLAPPRTNNTEPPVNHWLICGPTSTATPTDSPPPDSQSPSVPPGGSVPPTTPPGDGGLPVTGLALTGVVLSGVGLVGAGVALRAVRRRTDPAETQAEETESGDDESKDV
ncbi:MAG TPA: hypothetical protein VFZ32_13035 [Micromonosporaceae bacterium]